MAEQILSPPVKNKKTIISSQPQCNPRNEDNLSLLRSSKVESRESRCGPIHIPHRPLTSAPDPSEPVQTPPQPSFLTDRCYFKEPTTPYNKAAYTSVEAKAAKMGNEDQQDLIAAQKKLVEKEKDLSIKEARKSKRDAQEAADTYNYNHSAPSDSTTAPILFSLPLNFMPRDISTASTNVSTASPAARPFDDGRCVRAALLEELKTYEDLLKIGDNATNVSSATHSNLNQVASILDSMSKMGSYLHKGKLDLKDLNLTSKAIPVRAICQRRDRLHKLILKGNKLSTVPPQLVLDLHVLHTLDLQQCDLTKLPTKWNLGSLRKLIVSHNKLQDFLEEEALRGLPQLRHLDFYGNKLCELILPTSKNQVLTKLEYLNLGFNELTRLPEELMLLTSLRVLKVPNNLIDHVPKGITDMKNLHELEVVHNPIVQPPLEDCERGIEAMRRYYRGLAVKSSPCRATYEQMKSIDYSDLYHRSRGVRTSPSHASDKPTITLDYYSNFSTPPGSRTLGKLFRNKLFPFTYVGKRRKEMKKGINAKISSASSDTVERGISLSSASSISDTVKTNNENKEISNIEDHSNFSPFITARQQNSSILSPSHELKVQHPEEFQLPWQNTQLSSSSYAEMKERIQDEEKFDEYLMSEIMEQEHTAEVMPVNDTLKIIFVGMAYTGKTSLIRRLKYGSKATVPKNDERTIGVDVYDWDPSQSDEHTAECREILDTCIIGENGKIPDTSVKFSVWDFAGQHVYHATHELFFSRRALYVLVWDMGANNQLVERPANINSDYNEGPFARIDSGDLSEQADRALERDIDEKVQFWVDCIQSSVPGSVILPVATFDDYFDTRGKIEEARRRCNTLRRRLEKHEERRRAGIKERLDTLRSTGRANTEAARRLMTLLTATARPQFIFGGDDKLDSVIRVSSTQYRGFCELRRKIVNIACGRELGKHKYLFGGHMGVPIPRLRLEVRDVVRQKRVEDFVVEWQTFLSILRQILDKREEIRDDDVSDALQFLSTIGELSYFGRALDGSENPDDSKIEEETDDEDEDDEDILAIDDTSSELYIRYEESSNADKIRRASKARLGVSGLSEYVFLNPKWLVEVVACILRHDLRQEIDETKRRLEEEKDYEVKGDWKNRGRLLNASTIKCPIISAEEACMLWKTKTIICTAAERAKNEACNGANMTTYEFLQRLLIRFSVLVPIDLSVDKAVFGGEDYAANPGSTDSGEISLGKPRYFFLPSLLGSDKPTDQVWTYKYREAYKITLCVSWRFPDGSPPGLMERVTASVLRDIYAATQPQYNHPGKVFGKMRVIEILCWRTTFIITIGTPIQYISTGDTRESVVEIFGHLADKSDPFCVAADSMSYGDRRLIVSAKGQDGEGGRKIWKGGFEIILQAVERVVREYGGIEFEKQGVCPVCLAERDIAKVGVWGWNQVVQACKMGFTMPRCEAAGHSVDTRLVGGWCKESRYSKSIMENMQHLNSFPRHSSTESSKHSDSLVSAVVLVGLFDCNQHKIRRVGSGFIVDAKRGLIVTAAHTLCHWDEGKRFGEPYDGIRNAKVIVGIIPSQSTDFREKAVFRYMAEIVEMDELRMDACVIKIKTRLERDCVDKLLVPELILHDMRSESLDMLEVAKATPALEERVRIIGFDQGGEGLSAPGSILHREVSVSIGNVVKIFRPEKLKQKQKACSPRCEIVVDCITDTIGGFSGGPCVNQIGEVVGILSRCLPGEPKRCYLVPASEFKALVDKATQQKNSFSSLLE